MLILSQKKFIFENPLAYPILNLQGSIKITHL